MSHTNITSLRRFLSFSVPASAAALFVVAACGGDVIIADGQHEVDSGGASDTGTASSLDAATANDTATKDAALSNSCTRAFRFVEGAGASQCTAPSVNLFTNVPRCYVATCEGDTGCAATEGQTVCLPKQTCPEGWLPDLNDGPPICTGGYSKCGARICK